MTVADVVRWHKNMRGSRHAVLDKSLKDHRDQNDRMVVVRRNKNLIYLFIRVANNH